MGRQGLSVDSHMDVELSGGVLGSSDSLLGIIYSELLWGSR